MMDVYRLRNADNEDADFFLGSHSQLEGYLMEVKEAAIDRHIHLEETKTIGDRVVNVRDIIRKLLLLSEATSDDDIRVSLEAIVEAAWNDGRASASESAE